MALSLIELVKKYKAGTLSVVDLEESGYMMHQVESYEDNSSKITIPIPERLRVDSKILDNYFDGEGMTNENLSPILEKYKKL
jgi:hypothetical protein